MECIQGQYKPIVGFAGRSGKAGDSVEVIHTGFFTSDTKDFFTYIREIEKHFGLNGRIFSNFLIILKANQDLIFYPNFVGDKALISHKKEKIEKGEYILDKDIAGYQKILLSDIDIGEKDGVIFCFKMNRKFGLYFNFSPLLDDKKYSIQKDDLERLFGRFFTILYFDKELEYLNDKATYQKLIDDGRFPFFELLPHEYKILFDRYRDNISIDEINKKIVDAFDQKRIEQMQKKWYHNKFLLHKKTLIDAGIEAYFQGTQSGYITCLKTISTEVEGLITFFYMGTSNEEKYRPKDVIEHLRHYMYSSDSSNLLTLGFNENFVDYLLSKVFGHFDLKTGELNTSKNTMSHGVSSHTEYTQLKCLQYILIIDQLYYYFIEKK